MSETPWRNRPAVRTPELNDTRSIENDFDEGAKKPVGGGESDRSVRRLTPVRRIEGFGTFKSS
ncbi:MAG TPA: hypothetical protein VG711_08950 [Phycisphaerales bacterium]|nr:hypothetical protein [Phycisphaerales bacterium]